MNKISGKIGSIVNIAEKGFVEIEILFEAHYYSTTKIYLIAPKNQVKSLGIKSGQFGTFYLLEDIITAFFNSSEKNV